MRRIASIAGLRRVKHTMAMYGKYMNESFLSGLLRGWFKTTLAHKHIQRNKKIALNALRKLAWGMLHILIASSVTSWKVRAKYSKTISEAGRFVALITTTMYALVHRTQHSAVSSWKKNWNVSRMQVTAARNMLRWSRNLSKGVAGGVLSSWRERNHLRPCTSFLPVSF